MNIVTVDDSEAVLEYSSIVLESAGHTVFRAGSAAAAIDAISANPIDLVLSDVNMKGMDGFTLAQTLRNDLEHTDIRIIFVTGEDSEEFKSKSRRVGAN